MSTSNVLPNSRMRNPTQVTKSTWGPYRLNMVPIFCANCGADGGAVPEESSDFAFYLCDERANNCAAKWAPLTNTYMIPDEVFWKKVKEAQIEKYGRELEAFEIVEALKDDTHILSKLAKERGKK